MCTLKMPFYKMVICRGAVESRMYLRAGSSFYYHGGQTFGVSSYYMHPNYNSFTRDYDVALLQVRKFCNFVGK